MLEVTAYRTRDAELFLFAFKDDLSNGGLLYIPQKNLD